LYAFLTSPMHAMFPTHFILDLVIIITFVERQFSPVSCYFLCLLGPNIPLNTLFQNTLGLCSSFNMRDQVLPLCNILFLWWVVVNPPCWRPIPCWLSATAYSVYLQLPSISEVIYLTWKCGNEKFYSEHAFFLN
jgi:hypothetical protein